MKRSLIVQPLSLMKTSFFRKIAEYTQKQPNFLLKSFIDLSFSLQGDKKLTLNFTRTEIK